MTFHLHNASGNSFSFDDLGWRLVRQLAVRYGWQPAGTLPPSGQEDSSWSGQYDHPIGQQVSAPDAAALANALNKAVDDPGLDRTIQSLAAEFASLAEAAFGPKLAIAYQSALLSPRILIDLIGFCRGGSFRVE